jgi:hypothetical protein
LEHFDHIIIEAGTEPLTILIDQVVVGTSVFSHGDDFIVDRGDFGCLTRAKTTDAPEYKDDYDSKQDTTLIIQLPACFRITLSIHDLFFESFISGILADP